ncbi:hypothetical protein C8J56DRAFT_879544 [Mycena floridula]|nr:hypothetical protein C8J56DRAFT_879544 [Mycena floridula]
MGSVARCTWNCGALDWEHFDGHWELDIRGQDAARSLAPLVPRLANSDPDTHPIPRWGTVTPNSLPFVKDSETWKCIQAWNCDCNHCAIHIKNYGFHENVSRM